MAVPKDDFESIVREHQAMIYSIACNFFHNTHIAEEVAQDVFLQLYENLKSIESPAHLKAWLRRAATHRCIDFSRRSSVRNEIQMENLPDVAVEGRGSDPLFNDRMQRLVATLPEKQRLVVILKYGEDLDPEEIGQILDMPSATVRSHLQRAIILLREKARSFFPDKPDVGQPSTKGEINESVRRRSS